MSPTSAAVTSVESADGTPIAYEVHGDGEQIVLVHGSTGSRDHWTPFQPHLDSAGQLVTMDRRGAGASDDAPEQYALTREVEDVEVVLEATGASRLFGHSYGGLCALNVALRDRVDLDALVLFEPAVLVGEHREYDAAQRMAEHLTDGDREAAMRLVFEQFGIEDVESLPHWPAVVEQVEVTQREFAAVEAYDLPDPIDVDVEMLCLTAEHSPAFLRDGVREVRDRLPNSRLVEIEGVGHAGIADPAATAALVREFLE